MKRRDFVTLMPAVLRRHGRSPRARSISRACGALAC